MSEPGLAKQGSRILEAAVLDQDAARQDAERALENAHVAVEDELLDAGAFEQRLDGGDQHHVIGTDKFAQFLSPSSGLPADPLVAGAALPKIGDQLHLAPSARHGLEHETG